MNSIAFEWKMDHFKRSMESAGNVPRKSPEYSHESLPGLKWKFSISPRSPVANNRFGIDLFLNLVVSETTFGNVRQKYSAATSAFGGFKVQMKTADGRLSTPVQIDLGTLFGHATSGWGKRGCFDHAAVEKFCDDEGTLVLLGEIFLRKDVSRHTEFARHMFATGKHTDFSIIIGNEAFYVHKYVLEDVSPIFQQLITKRRYRETDASVSREAMTALLQHIYGYQLWFKDLPLLACEVLALAEKFQVNNGLVELCFAGMRDTMTPRNVISSYITGVERSYEPLKRVALDFICLNARQTLLSPEWCSLKDGGLETAMAICDHLFTHLRFSAPVLPVAAFTPPNPKKRKVETVATNTPASAPPINVDTIFVRWQIPEFRQLLHPTGDQPSISVSKLFSHENLPGIALELVVYLQCQASTAAKPPTNVAVILRHVTTSSKKSAATAPNSGFHLAFVHPVTAVQLPPKELPLQTVRCDGSEVGIACFANRTEVERLCADDGSVVLFGRILIEAASCRQINHSRKLFESGENSDFKVKFGPETFNAHKFVLSSSPVISGMFGLSCSEMDKQELTIRADTTAEAVKAMLQFWYGDPLSFEGLQELAADVLLLAGEQMSQKAFAGAAQKGISGLGLLKICESALIKLIKADNVFNLAAIAFLHNTPELARATSQFLVTNFDVLLRNQSAEWTKIKDTDKKLAVQIAEAVICR